MQLINGLITAGQSGGLSLENNGQGLVRKSFRLGCRLFGLRGSGSSIGRCSLVGCRCGIAAGGKQHNAHKNSIIRAAFCLSAASLKPVNGNNLQVLGAGGRRIILPALRIIETGCAFIDLQQLCRVL